MRKRASWPTHAVLIFGVLLRLGLALATPPERAYDNHFEPVEVMLEKGRLPDAADCWECYQPPAYYVVSAAGWLVARQIPGLAGETPEELEHLGRRTQQFISMLAGCATLYVCLGIYRRFRRLAAYEALGMALIALLPRHIYMSAMATNDAFTYLVASVAIYALLRVQAAGWLTRGCLIAGGLAGLTVLSKGYGWMTVMAAWMAVWLFTRTAEQGLERWRRELKRPLILVVSATLLVGIWPTVRNLWIFDQFQVDNFELQDSPMRFLPPGSVRETSFFSLRPRALLARPWVHVSHMDSVWTALYGRLWFDYEGFNTTQSGYPPWDALWERCREEYPIWNRARWEMLLDYSEAEMPPAFRRVAVVSLVAGLPLTLAVLAGSVLAIRRLHYSFALTLLWLHFFGTLFVPIFQTLRLPHFAAMKAAFMLCGLSSAPVLSAWLLWSVRGRVTHVIIYTLMIAGLVTLAVADAALVVLQFKHFAVPVG
ncbi:MAG: hypothetical protein ABIG44_01480 [Planctomycetota bacterium]